MIETIDARFRDYPKTDSDPDTLKRVVLMLGVFADQFAKGKTLLEGEDPAGIWRAAAVCVLHLSEQTKSIDLDDFWNNPRTEHPVFRRFKEAQRGLGREVSPQPAKGAMSDE